MQLLCQICLCHLPFFPFSGDINSHLLVIQLLISPSACY